MDDMNYCNGCGCPGYLTYCETCKPRPTPKDVAKTQAMLKDFRVANELWKRAHPNE